MPIYAMIRITQTLSTNEFAIASSIGSGSDKVLGYNY